MQLKDLMERCSQMGQLEIPKEFLTGDADYKNNDTAIHLVFCCNMVLSSLCFQFSKSTEPTCLVALTDQVVLPSVTEWDSREVEQALCFAVLAEYFLQVQDFPCFKVWNERAEQALANLRLIKHYKPLPTGRWI